jgi:hypothetical protein
LLVSRTTASGMDTAAAHSENFTRIFPADGGWVYSGDVGRDSYL